MRIVKDAYQHLADYINGFMQDDQGQPQLRWIDLWYDQILDPEQSETLDFPALFLDFGAQSIENNGEWEQHVELRVSVYLSIVSYMDTYRSGPNRDAALNYLELNAKLHDNLQGYRDPIVGTLSRVDFQPVRTPTNLIIYRQDYLTTLMEIGPAEARRARTVATDNELGIEPGSLPANNLGTRFKIEL